MSAKRARLFGGIQSRAGYPRLAGRLQVAGIYCRPGKRSRYGVPLGLQTGPFWGPSENDHRLAIG